MTETKGKYTIRRVDGNQAEIVESLRKMGASVQILSGVGHGCPDLLIGYRAKNILMEVKMPGGKLTRDEREWRENWRGQACVVRTAEQAIEYLQDLTEDE